MNDPLVTRHLGNLYIYINFVSPFSTFLVKLVTERQEGSKNKKNIPKWVTRVEMKDHSLSNHY